MSNLIVSVIAIALVAVMTLAGVYYGGSMFREYQAEAQASRLIGEGEQIAGTVSFYASEQQKLPDTVSDLVTKEYFHEAPAKGIHTRWAFSNGYAVNEIGTNDENHRSCLAGRRRIGFDAKAHCRNAAQAGCTPSTEESPASCNKHCLRTCYDQANRGMWNPYLDKDDPCCIDNSEDTTIPDPIFP